MNVLVIRGGYAHVCEFQYISHSSIMKTCVAMFLVFECDTIFFWDILAIPIELFFTKENTTAANISTHFLAFLS